MTLFTALIVGIIVGLGSGFLLPENMDHLLLNILVGICGSITGLGFYALFLNTGQGSSLFDLRVALSCAIGGCLGTLAFNGLHKLSSKKAVRLEHVEDSDLDLEKIDEA